MKYYFAILLCACLLAGCNPKVVSDLYTYEFASLPSDSVQVFLPDDSVPPRTLAIGKVKVVDGGLSVQGSYERVLQMAIDETAKWGGNGLILESHRAPDIISSIHRVWGTMLRMEHSASDSVVRTSLCKALGYSGDAGYSQHLQHQVNRQQYGKQREASSVNVLRLGIGPSWLVSRYQIGNRLYKSKGGVGITADYEHVWRSGLGIGVNYQHDYFSFDGGVSMRLNYIGPSVAFAYMQGGPWRWGSGIGVGYGWYSESLGNYSYTEDNLATLVYLNAEYMATKDIGIGLQMNAFTMRLKKPDDFELKDNEFYGIQRLGIQLALNYYF